MNNLHNNTLNDFILHLKKNFTHAKTHRDKLRYVKEYLNWLTTQQLLVEEVSYNNLMNFIGYLQDQGKAAYQRNYYIKAIEEYHNFKKISFNHTTLRIRTHRKTVKPLLESKDLAAICESYSPRNELDQLLLSLIIWQALEYEDIIRIELQDVQLTKGQLYIKSRKGRNARYLPLASHQVMQLHHYIENTKSKREERKTMLLIMTAAKTSLDNAWRKLSREVKKQALVKLNQKISNLQHLRQSRLAIWIEEHGLRQAQYKSGYTTVKGVERYRTQNTKALQEQLNKFHPLGNEALAKLSR
jgi:integrase/recombinase XerD